MVFDVPERCLDAVSNKAENTSEQTGITHANNAPGAARPHQISLLACYPVRAFVKDTGTQHKYRSKGASLLNGPFSVAEASEMASER